MKRIVLMAVLALALPVAGFASSVDFDFFNSGGTLTGNNSGLSLSGSMLTSVEGFGGSGAAVGALGSVSFSTGAMVSGSDQNGAVFAAGGSFIITGNGLKGVPNGVIFNGTFSGPVKWTLVGTQSNGTHDYMLTGQVSGTWLNTGKTVKGSTVQFFINTGKGFFNGDTDVIGGLTEINPPTVPEPGTLGLVGTGLLGLAGAIHRKYKS